ncbi:uncharacterized protein LOC127852138 [Dreissena polymorpha]|uniref:uncharacterized protein LOC127852138 n=1 Tax=Dreissena polymorpha TaxID=45954 RepID=UPI002264B676|nr:uncharacterized protein LOC127852138 [Dreissena polymorpha]
MTTLCILSFLFWTSIKQAESTYCPDVSPDVNVCSAAGIYNVSIVRLKHTSSEEFQQCFCDIKLDKPTNLAFNYYVDDFTDCGIHISIQKNHFTCKPGSLLPTLNESTRMTYNYGAFRDWCMVVKIEQPEDARFSIQCKLDTVTTMSFLHPSVTNVVSESTTPSPDMNTTYVIVTSYPTSPLHRCIRNKCKCNKCVSRNYCLYRRKPVKRLQNKRCCFCCWMVFCCGRTCCNYRFGRCSYQISAGCET